MSTRSHRKPASSTVWSPGTATPVGWSFWRTWNECRRKWYLRYHRALRTHDPAYLTLGTVYHALHEGVQPHQIMQAGEPYSQCLPEAKRLYDFRTQNARPPFPKASGTEVLFVAKRGLLKGIFTARVDRVEGDSGRDFKAQSDRIELDFSHWRTAGEVVGQLAASGLRQITLDMITKAKSPSVHEVVVRQQDVEAQVRVLEQMVSVAAKDVRAASRLERFANIEVLTAHLPRTLGRCTSYGSTCPYYDVCWGPEAAGTAHGLDEGRAAAMKQDSTLLAWKSYLL